MTLAPLAALAEDIALRCLDGEVVALRGLPRSGRTTVVKLVLDHLEGTCLLVDGRNVRNVGVPGVMDTIDRHIAAAIPREGSAQIIIDDFGHAMRHDIGYQFQAGLRARIVDRSDEARVGALLVARLGDPLRFRRQRGSPLTAVARFLFPPWYAATVFESVAHEIGWEPAHVEAFCGSNPALIDRLQREGAAGAMAFATENLESWLSDIDDSLQVRLSDICVRVTSQEPGDDRLAPLLSRAEGIRIAGALDHDRLCAELAGRWPADVPGSAARMALRIADDPAPLWIDRFFGPYPFAFGSLLMELGTRLGPRTLRLLGTSKGTEELTSEAVATLRLKIEAVRSTGLEVEWRLAHDEDYFELHARQLLLSRTAKAYGLPPVDRIVCAERLGNEGDSILIAPDFEGAERSWSRARKFLP